MRALVRFAGIGLLCLFVSSARADTNFHVEDIAEVVKDFDPAEKKKPVTDIVVLSEGYQDRAEFMNKARALAKQLRDSGTAEPIRDVTTFEFYYVWVPSRSAGAPWRNGEKPRETPFGAHVAKDGSLGTDDGAVDRAVKHVVKDTKHDTVSVVLIHLLSKHAGAVAGTPTNVPDANTHPDDVRDSADTPEDVYVKLAARDACEKGGFMVGRVRQVDLDMRAFLHEFGHARFGLDDEYANDKETPIPAKEKPVIALYPNTTIDPTGARWRKMVPELFSADGKIKAIHEGGAGYAKGIWHAERLCRMNQTRNQGFCKVCVAAMHATTKVHDEPLVAPVWVSPGDGAKPPVVVTDKGRFVALKWRPGSKEEPLAWRVELVATDGTVRWKRTFEGDDRSADMPEPAPGVYTLRLQGIRVAGMNPDVRSKAVETRFRMLADPVEVHGTGITEALTEAER